MAPRSRARELVIHPLLPGAARGGWPPARVRARLPPSANPRIAGWLAIGGAKWIPGQRNLEVVEELTRFAQERGYTVSQLAIAWTLAHPAVHAAIVGSRSTRHIEESLGAVRVALSEQDIADIERIVAGAVPMEEATPETMSEVMGLVDG
ncbi:MAG: aldo/keto reductase [Solirubrobacterales bacterium]|nr:aldo/keto reductase [Solirubrobacterales bacterium]MBV9800459.1 aldo/keto reductase [Solirubrobacterales bacterium]